jgi:hypothetical protein
MARNLAPNIDLTGIAGWWRLRLEDFGSNQLTNEVPGGQHFSLTSPAWVVVDGRPALSYSGQTTPTSYGTISVTANDLLHFPLDTVSALTVVARVSALGNGGNGFGRVVAFSNVFDFICRASALRIGGPTASGNSDWEAGGQSVFSTGRPAIIAFTYNAADNTIRNIVNGVEVATLNAGIGGNIDGNAGTTTLNLGRATNGTSGLNGYLYELAIFKNRQLTAAETVTLLKMRKRII